jgi:ribonuclease G
MVPRPGRAYPWLAEARGFLGQPAGRANPLTDDRPVVILVTSSPGEVRAIALDDEGAIDCAIERPGGPLGLGDQVIGRITARVPAMAGAFVALSGAEPDGFLPDTAGAAGLTEGRFVALRVTRGPQGGKGCRLAASGDAAEGPIRLLARGPGAVERLAALHPTADIRVDRPAVAAGLPPALRSRLHVGLGDLRSEADAEWSALEDLVVVLPAGARMTISPTPALTAIDVDAGAATADRRPKKEAQLALNRAVIPAIARQIRLRHLAGAIVVDSAGLPQRGRSVLADSFTAAFARDFAKPRFLGFSGLGLAEIQRPRLHPPLHELFAGAHAAGLAALAALTAAWEMQPGQTHAIQAAPAVIAAIDADVIARQQFRDRIGRAATLHAQSSDDGPSRAWRLVTVPQR